jgi:hypothetical protein
MKTLSFKVSEEEARLIQIRARHARLSVSEYLRQKAAGSRSGKQKPKLIRCQKTGAMIFAPLEDAAPLTTETVRAFLADFP